MWAKAHFIFKGLCMKKILILFLLVSCGKVDHNVKTKDVGGTVSFGPNFQAAAQFCDERYGTKTEEAERCFKDYREFYKVKIDVETFCESQYTNEQDILFCQNDMLEIKEYEKNGK